MTAIASILVCAVKITNSLTRRQQLFDTAAKLINVDSNVL